MDKIDQKYHLQLMLVLKQFLIKIVLAAIIQKQHINNNNNNNSNNNSNNSNQDNNNDNNNNNNKKIENRSNAWYFSILITYSYNNSRNERYFHRGENCMKNVVIT